MQSFLDWVLKLFSKQKRASAVTQTAGVGPASTFAVQSNNIDDVLNEDGTVKV